jgi:neutral ceramidase
MVQLKLVREDGVPLGAINWFAVHPTSMNNTNTLVSSDNVGYAAVLFEKRLNPGRLIGKVMALKGLRGTRCQGNGERYIMRS